MSLLQRKQSPHQAWRRWLNPYQLNLKPWFDSSLMPQDGLEKSQADRAYKKCTKLDFLQHFAE